MLKWIAYIPSVYRLWIDWYDVMISLLLNILWFMVECGNYMYVVNIVIIIFKYRLDCSLFLPIERKQICVSMYGLCCFPDFSCSFLNLLQFFSKNFFERCRRTCALSHFFPKAVCWYGQVDICHLIKMKIDNTNHPISTTTLSQWPNQMIMDGLLPTIFGLFISFILLYHFCCNSNQKYIKQIRYIGIGYMITFTLNCFLGLVWFINIRYNQTDVNEYHEYGFNLCIVIIQNLSYILNICLFYMLLLSRIYFTFKDTIYECNKYLLRFYASLILILLVSFPTLTVIIPLSCNLDFQSDKQLFYDAIGLSTLGAIDLFFNLSIIYIFVKNLYRLMLSQISGDRVAIIDNAASISINGYDQIMLQRNMTLIQLMTKHTILGIFAIFAAEFCYVLMIINWKMDKHGHDLLALIMEHLFNLSYCTVILCVFLSYSFSKRWYQCCCKYCDACCLSLCIKMTNTSHVGINTGFDM